MSKNSDSALFKGIAIGVTVTLVVAIFIYYLNENRRLKTALENKEEENKKIKQSSAELKLEVEKIIDSKSEIDDLTKKDLKMLIDEFQDVDTKIADELISAGGLIEIQLETKAIASLVTIIEKLLKKIFELYENKKPKLNLKGLINYAKEKKLLSDEEYYMLESTRVIRNEGTHEPGVKKELKVTKSVIMVALVLIGKLKNLVKN